MRLEDKFVARLSTWTFTIVQCTLTGVWCASNWLFPTKFQFDPYPFIFLNLVVSLWAMLQNSFLMISQYKLSQNDRQLALDTAENTDRILSKLKRVEKKILDELDEEE